MHIKCSRPSCLHEWDYKGASRHLVTCPMCRKQVRLYCPAKPAVKEKKSD